MYNFVRVPKNKYHRIALSDIRYVEGLRNYVLFQCVDGKVITLQNLKDLEAQLPAGTYSYGVPKQ